MPYLQLDAPLTIAPDTRAELARRLAELYAEVMQTVPDVVTVAVRELGENGVLRYRGGGVEPAVVVSCDVRRGRSRESRLALGHRVAELLEDALGWPRERVTVEFTQHAADEIFREGRLAREWSPDEAARASLAAHPCDLDERGRGAGGGGA